MFTKAPVALAIIALTAAAQSASAISVFLTDVSPRASMTVTFPGMSAETTNYVGRINWSFNPSNPENAGLAAIIPGSTISTFCIEGTQNVFINQTANFANLYSDISLAPKDNIGSAYIMGSAKAAALNLFWDAYYDQAGLSNINGAAFQLGIWEILYDGAPNLTNGLFKATPTASGESEQAYLKAQNWLSNYGSVIATTHYQLYALSDPSLQDQLFGVAVPSGGGSPTPLPAGAWAGMTLMGLMGIVRKLKKRA